MLSYQNQSKTLIIVLHEIYGINNHITQVCEQLATQGFDVLCPDLLDDRPPFPYEKQEEAYRYFMNFVGLEAAAKRVTFLLRQEEPNYQNIFLLGYSVGATAAWMCSISNGADDEPIHLGGNLIKCSGIICYYGSRIRDYTDVTLHCPALLLFGEEEKSFDPKDLKAKLTKFELAEFHILNGKHGFANPNSEHYAETSAKEAGHLVNEFIRRNMSKMKA